MGQRTGPARGPMRALQRRRTKIDVKSYGGFRLRGVSKAPLLRCEEETQHQLIRRDERAYREVRRVHLEDGVGFRTRAKVGERSPVKRWISKDRHPPVHVGTHFL